MHSILDYSDLILIYHVGCTDGFWGITCGQSCGRCRFETACDRLTGECRFGCEAGWEAPRCDTGATLIFLHMLCVSNLVFSDTVYSACRTLQLNCWLH